MYDQKHSVYLQCIYFLYIVRRSQAMAISSLPLEASDIKSDYKAPILDIIHKDMSIMPKYTTDVYHKGLRRIKIVKRAAKGDNWNDISGRLPLPWAKGRR